MNRQMERRMDKRRLIISTAMLALTVAPSGLALRAQGPMYDKVKVNLPYTVTLGDKTLEPGDYVIQQLSSAANSYVLLVYSDNGMRFETSVMTIPALENKTPEHTDVVLHHFGSDYYFDKIWIQGKDYGYEFPLPDSVKGRERERLEPVNVGATYQQAPAETPVTTAQTTQPQPAPTPAPAPEAVTPAPEPAPAAEASATPAPEAAAPAPEPAPAPEVAQNDDAGQNSADREMPQTAADWLMMLLSGGALSGAGLMLRRKVG